MSCSAALDLGMGGMRIRTPYSLIAGAVVFVMFVVSVGSDDYSVKSQAKVVWSNQISPALPQCMGLEFVGEQTSNYILVMYLAKIGAPLRY